MALVSQPRYWAVKVLTRVSHGAYSNLVLNQVLQRNHFKRVDANLLTRLVYGTLQHLITLKYDLRPFLRSPQQIPVSIRVLLLTAVYQLRYLNRIPNHAVLNESIQIAKLLGTTGQRRLVTGILHHAIRQGFPGVNRIASSQFRRAVKFSVPVWIVRELSRQLGDAKTKSILRALNRPAKQSVRVNRRLVSDRQLVTNLKRDGYRVVPSRIADEGYLVKGRPVYRSREFATGELTIQDESAMLPVQSMHIRPNALILDACAAPGGKTGQIAERLDPEQGGRVVALDLYTGRLKMIRQNVQRLHLNRCVRTVALDARHVDQRFSDNTFDQILVDAPCSGLGLMQRKPEIRYFRRPTDVDRLAKVQLAILTAVAPKLKVGGQLTYSTCTILDQENTDVVRRFLARCHNFRVKPISLNRQTYSTLKIYPDDFGSDGFFVCDLIKTRS